MTTATATKLTGKRNLHIELVDRQDKPCAKCGNKDRREIHRVIHGENGGQYTLDNVQVLCHNCHTLEHYHAKFRAGERVWVDGRSPQYLEDTIDKSTPYIVLAVSYDGVRQCSIYTLDGVEYEFRSYQLKSVGSSQHLNN